MLCRIMLQLKIVYVIIRKVIKNEKVKNRFGGYPLAFGRNFLGIFRLLRSIFIYIS